MSQIQAFVDRVSGKAKQEYLGRRNALTPRVEKAKAVPTLTIPLTSAMQLAEAKAGKKRYVEAQGALDQAERLVDMAEAMPSDPLKVIAVGTQLETIWAPTYRLPVVEVGLQRLREGVQKDLKAGEADKAEKQLPFLREKVTESMAAFKEYNEVFAAVEQHLEDLTKAGAPEVAVLRADAAEANRPASLGDYVGAEMFLSGVRTTAEDLAKQYPGRTDPAAYLAAKAKLEPRYQGALAKVTPVPLLAPVQNELTTAYGLLTPALSGPLPAAKLLLDDLLKKITAAEKAAEEVAVREGVVRSALAELKPRTDKSQPPVTTYTTPIQQAVTTRVGSTNTLLTQRKVDKAEAELPALRAELATMEKAITEYNDHKTKFDKVRDSAVKDALALALAPPALAASRTDGLNKTRDGIVQVAFAGQIPEANRRLAVWQTQAEGWQATAAEAAEARATLTAPPPDPNKLKALLKKPGGAKVFDDVVASLGDKPPKNVMKVVFQERYGIKLDLTKGGQDVATAKGSKSVKRMYELLALVPESHTTKSKSLKKITRDTTEAKSGFYRGGKDKLIFLNCGRAGEYHGNAIGDATQLPDIEPDCQPATADPGTFFDWTTVHEIGHAVDDLGKYMSSKLTGEAYGGWQVYGSDPTPVATAARDHFVVGPNKFPLKDIKALLTNAPAKPYDAPPAAPTGVDATAWRNKWREIVDWCFDGRAANNPWDNGARCKTREIGGKVYHEAYTSPQWVSYSLAARTKGITGYQFRAPGEWFSELYAAYHTGKLKPAHPAVQWLKDL